MFSIPTALLKEDFIREAKTILANPAFAAEKGRLQDSKNTTRQTLEFGYRYADMMRGDFTRTEIPDFLSTLRREAVWHISKCLDRPLPVAEDFSNCILSIYEAGFKLQPHIDTDETRVPDSNGVKPNFHFGNDIIGVVIKADSMGSLYFLDARTREELNNSCPQPLAEEDGLVYLLEGPIRRVFHGVSPVAEKRISITYRTVSIG